jgi:hypothetical protein
MNGREREAWQQFGTHFFCLLATPFNYGRKLADRGLFLKFSVYRSHKGGASAGRRRTAGSIRL